MRTNRTLATVLSAVLAAVPAAASSQTGSKGPAAPKWDPAQVGAVAAWLGQRAVPLTSVRAGAGFDDLRPLGALLRDVRVVGLGEATHGTREFFQFKHRMLEFLVRELGFTAFAIEASYPACWNIDAYVLGGPGDPAAALASQGFWTWDTNEVSEMIAWMREYNRTAPAGRKVRFLGYDIQHLGRVLAVVSDYLGRVDPDAVEPARAALEPLLDMKSVQALRKKPAEELKRVEGPYRDLLAHMAFHRTPYVRGSSAAEYEEVLQHIRVAGQFFNSYAVTPAGPEAAARLSRDFYMADNIWQLSQALAPGTKMVVWAHNAHVSKGDLYGSPAMGAYLARFFGEAYYAIGFSFDRGSFQACDVGSPRWASEGCILAEFTVGPAPEGSIDWFLARPGIPNYFVDIRGAAGDPTVSRWLAAEMPLRFVGSGYSAKAPDVNFGQTRLERDYDGLVFFGTTSRARPNPTGMRPKPAGADK
ncbi:MAG TPA: erythromycin esterase family protein [Candidatus Aminicenantes bacterium]|nr:erythromycin esterase family protein [Candidatus Aminicenantes bacterium]